MSSPTNPNDPRDLNDSELGAALGASLHNRTDAVPNITPGFDGVEHRARQITNRRRALAGAAIGALVVFGGIGLVALTDDDQSDTQTFDEPDTDETVPPETVPADDVVDDDADGDVDVPAEPSTDIRSATGIIEGRVVILVTDVDSDDPVESELYVAEAGSTVTDALHLADGSTLIELQAEGADGDRRVLFMSEVDAEPVELSAYGDLAGGAVIDGVPYAFVGDLPDYRAGFPEAPLDVGDLRLVDLRDLSSRTFLPAAYGIEWGVDHVDVHDGLILVASSSEAGPYWQVLDLAGADLGFPMPIDESWHPAQGGDLVAQEPRFDAEGDGLVFLLHDIVNNTWTLEATNFDGTQPSSIPLRPSDSEEFVELELVSDGNTTAANALTVDFSDNSRTYVETIWIVAPHNEPSVEVEPGEVGLVQAPQTSKVPVAPAEPNTPVDPSPAATNPTGEAFHTVIDGAFVEIGADGSTRVLLDDPEALAYALAEDGSVIVTRPGVREDSLAGAGEIVQLIDGTLDGTTRVLSAEGRLAGLATIDGRAVAFVSDSPDASVNEEATTPLRSVDLGTGESTVLEEGVNGIEWRMSVADYSEGVILIDVAGYSPSWTFVSPTGIDLELASPTDGRFGIGWGDTTGPDDIDVPCCVGLSDDGERLYWLEHRTEDWQHNTDLPARVRGMDLATGDIIADIEVPLPGSEGPVTFEMDVANWDAIVSVSGVISPVTGESVQAIYVDLTNATTNPLDFPGGPWTFAS